jgi:hypothetical protein
MLFASPFTGYVGGAVKKASIYLASFDDDAQASLFVFCPCVFSTLPLYVAGSHVLNVTMS